MHHRKNRLWELIRAKYGALATWSDTPDGRLFRWTIGIGLVVYSIGAGHPVVG
jgi:hypothetical protein